jgi:hypothetical protein
MIFLLSNTKRLTVNFPICAVLTESNQGTALVKELHGEFEPQPDQVVAVPKKS